MMELQEIYKAYEASSGVSIDTRTLKRGDLFFAIRGERMDGHQFISNAIEKGASYAIIDNPEFHGERTILVHDTIRTLQDLANYHRKKGLIGHVIGITGSNGKTTTKELIYSILSRKYKTYATLGNLNNHLGVPLTILIRRSNFDLAIIEMGANKKGDIQELCEIAEIDYGLITNIGRAHLEGFGGIEGVRKTKSELYHNLVANGGMAFVDPNERSLQGVIPTDMKVYEYFPQLELISNDTFLCFRFKDRQGNAYMVSSLMTGEYNLQNIGYAISVSEFFQVPPQEIVKGIESYEPNNNRSERRKINSAHIILDAYNANPDSMMASINNLMAQNDAPKYLILGDMLELGDYSPSLHQEIIDYIAGLPAEGVFLYGPAFGACNTPDHFIKYDDFDQLKNDFMPLLEKEAWILIKGSRGMKLERLLS